MEDLTFTEWLVTRQELVYQATSGGEMAQIVRCDNSWPSRVNTEKEFRTYLRSLNVNATTLKILDNAWRSYERYLGTQRVERFLTKRSTEKKLAEERDARAIPSETYDTSFLRVQYQGHYPRRVEGRSGKWLVPLKKGEPIDTMWLRVKEALSRGELGETAKVSTMKPNPHEVNPDEGVICVYTYSLDDREDVERIRTTLRALGVTRKIPYTLDKDVGKYSNQGHIRLSQLYE